MQVFIHQFFRLKTNLESFLSFLLLTLSSPSFSSSSNISSSSSILGTFLYSSACFRSSYKYQLFKMYSNFNAKVFSYSFKGPPSFERGMSDSQRYPWNLNLINYVEDKIVFYLEKWVTQWYWFSCSRNEEVNFA